MMTIIIAIIIFMFLLGIAIAVGVFIARNALNTALGSLLSILAGLAASSIAPSAEGKADVNLDFGPLGNITAHWIKLNTPNPADTWYVAFITIGILTAIALYMVYDGKRSSDVSENH